MLGVVLVNMGGPDSLEAVEPFLRNLFDDEDLIRLPWGRTGQRTLARLIASRRALASPAGLLNARRQLLDDLTDRSGAALRSRLRGLRRELDALSRRRPLISPAAIFVGARALARAGEPRHCGRAAGAWRFRLRCGVVRGTSLGARASDAPCAGGRRRIGRDGLTKRPT